MCIGTHPAIDQYLHDFSQARRVSDLRRAALTDPLTGLGNRTRVADTKTASSEAMTWPTAWVARSSSSSFRMPIRRVPRTCPSASVTRGDTADFNAALQRADAAQYESKHAGRDRVTSSSGSLPS